MNEGKIVDANQQFTVEQYVAEVGQCILRGVTTRDPLTRGELEAAVDAYPDDAGRWIPDTESLKSLEIPAHFGGAVDPWGDLQRDRFLQTLVGDDEFWAAVKAVLEDER